MAKVNATIARRGLFGLIVLGYSQRTDTNQTSLAARIGVPESSLRAWINNDRSPAVDWVLFNSHKLPDDLLAGLLTELAGDRFVIEPIDRGAGAGVSLVRGAVDITARCAHLAQVVDDAAADGLITRDEAAGITNGIGGVYTALRRLSVAVAVVVGKTLCGRLIGRGH